MQTGKIIAGALRRSSDNYYKKRFEYRWPWKHMYQNNIHVSEVRGRCILNIYPFHFLSLSLYLSLYIYIYIYIFLSLSVYIYIKREK